MMNARSLGKYKLHAIDGDIGEIIDTYIDCQNWMVRYLMIDTGHWLPGRKVLISTHSISSIDADAHRIVLSITTNQIKKSPVSHHTHQIKRDYETQLHSHYKWPVYWEGSNKPVTQQEDSRSLIDEETQYLYSVENLRTYDVQADNTRFGHIHDVLFDQKWRIHFLVINTNAIIPGGKKLLPIEYISDISLHEETIATSIDHDTLHHAPQYHSHYVIDDTYERSILDVPARDKFYRTRGINQGIKHFHYVKVIFKNW